MNYLEASEIIAQITYKRGVRINFVRSGDSGSIEVRMSRQEPDAREYDPNHMVVIVGYCQIFLQHANEDMILHMVRDMVRNFELHEMDEWLKYRGKHMKDPHPELKERTNVNR